MTAAKRTKKPPAMDRCDKCKRDVERKTMCVVSFTGGRRYLVCQPCIRGELGVDGGAK